MLESFEHDRKFDEYNIVGNAQYLQHRLMFNECYAFCIHSQMTWNYEGKSFFLNENEYCLNWEFFWRPWTVMYIVNYYYYYFIQCFNLTMEHFINSSITIHIYLQFRNQSYHIYCWQKNSLLRIFVHLFMLMCYLRENARSICIWMKTNFYISSIIINKFVWRVQKVAIEKAIVIFIFFVSACWCVCRGKFDWKH